MKQCLKCYAAIQEDDFLCNSCLISEISRKLNASCKNTNTFESVNPFVAPQANIGGNVSAPPPFMAFQNNPFASPQTNVSENTPITSPFTAPQNNPFASPQTNAGGNAPTSSPFTAPQSTSFAAAQTNPVESAPDSVQSPELQIPSSNPFGGMSADDLGFKSVLG